MQDGDDGRRLDDAFPAAKPLRLRTAGPALIVGTALVIFLLILGGGVEDPFLQVAWLRAADDVLRVPYPVEIRLSIGPARRGRREIRLAVGSARDARGWPIQPLSTDRARSHRQNERREQQPHTPLRFRSGNAANGGILTRIPAPGSPRNPVRAGVPLV